MSGWGALIYAEGNIFGVIFLVSVGMGVELTLRDLAVQLLNHAHLPNNKHAVEQEVLE